MLILGRREEQEIVIGENGHIRLKVLEARNGYCRIGITADRSVPVDRLEIWESKQRGEKPKAAE